MSIVHWKLKPVDQNVGDQALHVYRSPETETSRSDPYAYAQHAHQFLTRILSISIKIPNLKEVPTNHAEHTRKGLECMLRIRVRN